MGAFTRFGISISLAALAATLSPAAAGTLPARESFSRPAQPAIADAISRRGDVRDLGRAPDATLVTLALTLNYQRQSELARLVSMQSDRRSPYYRHFLNTAQFPAYFAPSQRDSARAIAALQHAGFRITHTFANRTMIDAA